MPTARERVVVTGMGIASPIGNDLDTLTRALREARPGVRLMDEWEGRDDLGSRVAGVVDGIDLAGSIPRKHRRTMGRVAQLATWAATRAVSDAGLTEEVVTHGRLGLAIGSTTGSVDATLSYYRNILGPGVRANKSTAFLQVMSHTCAANVALALGVTGRVWGPSSACTSGSQAIGLGLDTLRAGSQDIMVCGGAEEVHYTTAGVFDLAGAASRAREATPRPFDRDRDGMVVGEGAGILVLERYEHARARGARSYGEVLGFATTCDGTHITSPAPAGMQRCIELALTDAGVTVTDVDYVNAHATGTELGDPSEAQATARVFGDRTPVSSTKGLTGHTLGACGGIESIFVLQMLREGFVAANHNLDQVDPDCTGPWLVTETLERPIEVAINNNFAFGGINTSLVLGRP